MQDLRPTRSFAGLVDELDDRLPRSEPEILEMKRGRTVPTWLALIVVTALLVGSGWLVLQPTRSTCEFSETVCAIEALDIDALFLTIPDANLFDILPTIDVIDPDDTLTLGDVLRMDALRDRDPNSLISPAQIQRVLDQLD
ncbi:MAG: hypothetical protein AAF567_08390 [Actinomycetota bacterium]